MVLESGIERRQNPWSVKIAQRRHRGGAICLCFWAIFCCFLLGYLGHWNRDRDCEPAQLTGCLLGVEASCLLLAAYRAPNPASVEPLPRRGFDLTLCAQGRLSFEP